MIFLVEPALLHDSMIPWFKLSSSTSYRLKLSCTFMLPMFCVSWLNILWRSHLPECCYGFSMIFHADFHVCEVAMAWCYLTSFLRLNAEFYCRIVGIELVCSLSLLLLLRSSSSSAPFIFQTINHQTTFLLESHKKTPNIIYALGPLLVPTRAARSRRSLIFQPDCMTWTTLSFSWGLVFGNNFRVLLWFSEVLQSVHLVFVNCTQLSCNFATIIFVPKYTNEYRFISFLLPPRYPPETSPRESWGQIFHPSDYTS